MVVLPGNRRERPGHLRRRQGHPGRHRLRGRGWSRGDTAEVLKKAQELDDTEHRMLPFIEKFRSIREAVKQFGRI